MIEQKNVMNQMMEDRLDLLTKTVEKQRKRRRMQDENEDDNYVPNTVFLAEKMKVEVSCNTYSLH